MGDRQRGGAGAPTRTRHSMRLVAASYGWPADITDDDALRELLVLNGG